MGFFAKIKEALKKTKDAISYKFNKLFTGGVLNGEFYDELEAILLSADIGSETTESILDELKTVVDKKHITRTEDVRGELKTIMHDLLDFEIPEEEYPLVILMAGVNGVGKTTTVGKLAQLFRKKGKSVTIVAGDTFRAAAADQLTVWAERAGVRIVKQGEGADAAAVVYDALQSAKSKGTDVTIVDTAGRLHNKVNLMEELKKIDRVTVYTPPVHGAIAAFNVRDYKSEHVADILSSEYDIAVRSGLHCAPKMHEHLGTTAQGIVRASLGCDNTLEQCDFLLRAVAEIAS